MKKQIKLSDSDLLAMYRNMFYSKMGVTNQDKMPNDEQITSWFQKVCAQAEQRRNPEAYMMGEHPNLNVPCAALDRPNRKGEIVIRRIDFMCAALPSWRQDKTTVPTRGKDTLRLGK